MEKSHDPDTTVDPAVIPPRALGLSQLFPVSLPMEAGGLGGRRGGFLKGRGS